MRRRIRTEEFPVYEVMILTGRLEATEVVALMRDNPKFTDWYASRAKEAKEARARKDHTANLIAVAKRTAAQRRGLVLSQRKRPSRAASVSAENSR